MKNYPQTLKAKLAKIELLVLDVDGVLADGSMVYDRNGLSLKNFNSLDGFAIVMARHAKIRCAILTSRKSAAVAKRAQDLKFDFYEAGHEHKIPALQNIMRMANVNKEQTLFMGDDLPDLACMSYVGIFVAPKNAAERVKEFADWQTENTGGNGAVREMIEGLLRAQDRLEQIEDYFLKEQEQNV